MNKLEKVIMAMNHDDPKKLSQSEIEDMKLPIHCFVCGKNIKCTIKQIRLGLRNGKILTDDNDQLCIFCSKDCYKIKKLKE